MPTNEKKNELNSKCLLFKRKQGWSTITSSLTNLFAYLHLSFEHSGLCKAAYRPFHPSLISWRKNCWKICNFVPCVKTLIWNTRSFLNSSFWWREYWNMTLQILRTKKPNEPPYILFIEHKDCGWYCLLRSFLGPLSFYAHICNIFWYFHEYTMC